MNTTENTALQADAEVGAAPTTIDALDRAAEAIAAGVPIGELLAAQAERHGNVAPAPHLERGHGLPASPGLAAALGRTEDTVHVAHYAKGIVTLDAHPLGIVTGSRRELYRASTTDGEDVVTNADCIATAIDRLVRTRLNLGDSYRITGLASATGGPWTLA